jgi:hypothetical protein
MSKRGERQAYRQTRADATERYVDGRDTLRERRSEKDGERERERGECWTEEAYGCKVVTERMAGIRMPKGGMVEDLIDRPRLTETAVHGPIKESGRIIWGRELSL